MRTFYYYTIIYQWPSRATMGMRWNKFKTHFKTRNKHCMMIKYYFTIYFDVCKITRNSRSCLFIYTNSLFASNYAYITKYFMCRKGGNEFQNQGTREYWEFLLHVCILILVYSSCAEDELLNTCWSWKHDFKNLTISSKIPKNLTFLLTADIKWEVRWHFPTFPLSKLALNTLGN